VRRRGVHAVLSLGAAAILVVSGCIPPRPSPSASPPAPTSAATATPAPTASVASPAAGVTVDASLLGILPGSVGGVAITPDPETAAQIADEGSIAPFVSAIALAAAFGPPASDGTADYVVVTVAKLRPGTFSDLFFRGWRDTFDAGVCEQAGGVDGNAETDIDGHRTFIGTCKGGVHTYHVHLATSDVIVSMQGLGRGGWPERIVADLTE
jgi:hypothetical protein